ncbi:uncharacterized protein LOC126592752 isoform X3 [Malus sylvestris]|uniref:uncharacterized protein LOC126592752 isoform X3 n=1 Tax=Malus sylvestris TaxID=3752 RepID=UPI0021AC3663|nr:uncharacterized protein LOC126592752 isoform X3 [Malus sylvestris]
MAASKLVILSIFLALIFSQIRAVASIPAEEEEPVKFPRSDTPDSSALKIELNQLRAKILAMMARALYLASIEDLETVWCFFEAHEIGFEPRKTTNSKVNLLSFGSPAKFASLYDWRYFGFDLK